MSSQKVVIVVENRLYSIWANRNRAILELTWRNSSKNTSRATKYDSKTCRLDSTKIL